MCEVFLLKGEPLFLFTLNNNADRIANGVSGAAMPCPGISNQEKDNSLLPVQWVVPLFNLTVDEIPNTLSANRG